MALHGYLFEESWRVDLLSFGDSASKWHGHCLLWYFGTICYRVCYQLDETHNYRLCPTEPSTTDHAQVLGTCRVYQESNFLRCPRRWCHLRCTASRFEPLPYLSHYWSRCSKPRINNLHRANPWLDGTLLLHVWYHRRPEGSQTLPQKFHRYVSRFSTRYLWHRPKWHHDKLSAACAFFRTGAFRNLSGLRHKDRLLWWRCSQAYRWLLSFKTNSIPFGSTYLQ